MNRMYLALAAAATLLGAGAAQAGGVSWSIGISTPFVGTVISNGPGYGPAYGPVYAPAYAPVYAPPPVVYAPEPIYYAPAPVVYRPLPVPYFRPRVFLPPPLPLIYARHHPGWRPYGYPIGHRPLR